MPFLQQIWSKQKCLTSLTNIPRVRKCGEKKKKRLFNNIIILYFLQHLNKLSYMIFGASSFHLKQYIQELRNYLHLSGKIQLLWVLGPPPPLVEDRIITECFWFESHELSWWSPSNTSLIQSHPGLPPQTACCSFLILITSCQYSWAKKTSR